MTATRALWLTWPMVFSISLFVAPSNALAQASLCGKWASVSGWKGDYTLTGSGTGSIGTGTATATYSSSGTLQLTNPGSQGCPSSMLEWAAPIDSSNATASASYKLSAPCKEGGTATVSWSTSQVSSTPSFAELIVDPTHGSIVFSPLLFSMPLNAIGVGCDGKVTQVPLPAIAFTPVLPSQMPKFNLPDKPGTTASKINVQFSTLDTQTGVTVNWTLSFTLTPDCDVPDGELTAWDGWGPEFPLTTVGLWKQTLLSGSGASFAGLTVKEVDAGGGLDTCWFPGSAIPKQTSLSGGTWEVQDDNTWGPDAVGWPSHAVSYYQLLHPRAPCGFTVHQQMQFACYDGSQHNYGPVNTLQGTIDENDVTSIRAGHHASRRTE